MWEQLLFTQFHDTIGGSHPDSVYVPAMKRTQTVLEEAFHLAEQSLRACLPASDEAGPCLVVFNPLSWSRSGLCRMAIPGVPAGSLAITDAEGHVVPARVLDESTGSGGNAVKVEFQASEVPATGWKTYQVIQGTAPVGTAADAVDADAGVDNSLENAYFRIAWDPTTGDLLSIWDKTLGRELLAGPGNAAVAARETNPDMEGQIYLTGAEACSGDYRVTSVEVTQDALASRLRVRGPFQDCTLVRETALDNFAPRLDFMTRLEDFNGGDVLIKASFPLKIDWSKAERVCETAFAATPKPEGHFAAQTWADCSDGEWGAALFNYGTPGYWVAGGRLELVLMRSLANYTGYQQNGRRLGLSIYSNSTDMELAREHGSHTFSYTLFPHAGTWRDGDLSRLGQGLNTPFVALAGLPANAHTTRDESLVAFGPDFIMTALKVAENGQGLIVRGFETRGEAHAVTLRVAPWVRKVVRATLLEEPGDPLSLKDGAVEFACAPHEIVTLLLTH